MQCISVVVCSLVRVLLETGCSWSSLMFALEFFALAMVLALGKYSGRMTPEEQL